MKIQKAGYQGLYFPDFKVAVDGHHPGADYVFVSHAHADHMPRNRSSKAYASQATINLMRHRGFKGKGHALGFGEIIESDRFLARIYPAGHILGSSMIYLESEKESLLYTGDFRTPPSPATEGFEAPDQVDILITEATFSLPIYRWKTNDELAEEVRSFASNTLTDNYTPVFLAYNLGKAQELMHLLAPLDQTVMIHGAGYKMCPVYEENGIDLGKYEAYDRENCEGNILICPSSAFSNGFASNVSKKRIAYCSGWASNESRRTQLTVDKLIALSDHLDFFELIKFCKQLNPKKVYITHTPNPAVVKHYLTKEKIDAGHIDIEMNEED
jgi:putative mRNA 3-end processing factor